MEKCLNKNCQEDFVPKTYNQKFCSIKCRNFKCQKDYVDKHKHKCKCGNLIRKESTECKNCSYSSAWEMIKEATLAEYQNLPSVKNKHLSWRNSHIRSFARSHNKDLCNSSCQHKGCSYYLHVEICHIKPISSFPLTTKIKDINEKSNLIALCRNCHWELDHGYWKL